MYMCVSYICVCSLAQGDNVAEPLQVDTGKDDLFCIRCRCRDDLVIVARQAGTLLIPNGRQPTPGIRHRYKIADRFQRKPQIYPESGRKLSTLVSSLAKLDSNSLRIDPIRAPSE